MIFFKRLEWEGFSIVNNKGGEWKVSIPKCFDLRLALCTGVYELRALLTKAFTCIVN